MQLDILFFRHLIHSSFRRKNHSVVPCIGRLGLSFSRKSISTFRRRKNNVVSNIANFVLFSSSLISKLHIPLETSNNLKTIGRMNDSNNIELSFDFKSRFGIDYLVGMNEDLYIARSSSSINILLETMYTHFSVATLLAAMNIVVVLPSNLLTLIVIITNRDLWTTSNVVLIINGFIQALGSGMYLITRILWFHSLFFVSSNNDYKETIYLVYWWTYSIMMRTGNNR